MQPARVAEWSRGRAVLGSADAQALAPRLYMFLLRERSALRRLTRCQHHNYAPCLIVLFNAFYTSEAAHGTRCALDAGAALVIRTNCRWSFGVLLVLPRSALLRPLKTLVKEAVWKAYHAHRASMCVGKERLPRSARAGFGAWSVPPWRPAKAQSMRRPSPM